MKTKKIISITLGILIIIIAIIMPFHLSSICHEYANHQDWTMSSWGAVKIYGLIYSAIISVLTIILILINTIKKRLNMKRKIYFSGSIAGGRNDVDLYHRIIEMIKETDIVLTEHIGNSNYSIANRTKKDDENIYTQDTNWLKECDIVIAECSVPSLGVGYEMSYAEQLNKPVYIFYRDDIYLSAMLNGNPNFTCQSYKTEEELINKIKEILNKE